MALNFDAIIQRALDFADTEGRNRERLADMQLQRATEDTRYTRLRSDRLEDEKRQRTERIEDDERRAQLTFDSKVKEADYAYTMTLRQRVKTMVNTLKLKIDSKKIDTMTREELEDYISTEVGPEAQKFITATMAEDDKQLAIAINRAGRGVDPNLSDYSPVDYGKTALQDPRIGQIAAQMKVSPNKGVQKLADQLASGQRKLGDVMQSIANDKDALPEAQKIIREYNELAAGNAVSEAKNTLAMLRINSSGSTDRTAIEALIKQRGEKLQDLSARFPGLVPPEVFVSKFNYDDEDSAKKSQPIAPSRELLPGVADKQVPFPDAVSKVFAEEDAIFDQPQFGGILPPVGRAAKSALALGVEAGSAVLGAGKTILFGGDFRRPVSPYSESDLELTMRGDGKSVWPAKQGKYAAEKAKAGRLLDPAELKEMFGGDPYGASEEESLAVAERMRDEGYSPDELVQYNEDARAGKAPESMIRRVAGHLRSVRGSASPSPAVRSGLVPSGFGIPTPARTGDFGIPRSSELY